MPHTGFHMGHVMWPSCSTVVDKNMVDFMRSQNLWEENISQAKVNVKEDFAPDFSIPSLGEGGYGEVYTCAKHPHLAVKVYSHELEEEELVLMMSVLYGNTHFEPGEPWHFSNMRDYQKTAVTLQKLARIPGYKHVHPIVHYSREANALYSPRCEGSVRNLLDTQPHLLQEMTSTWHKLARDMCAAVTYMHACDVCHLDIKPANIFYNVVGQIHQFYLSDFDTVVPNVLTRSARGTDKYMFRAWRKKWSPGIFPDDADKYALCKTLTVNLLCLALEEKALEALETKALQQKALQQKELQQHMLRVLRLLDAPKTAESYKQQYKSIHTEVFDAFALFLIQLGLHSFEEIREKRAEALGTTHHRVQK